MKTLAPLSARLRIRSGEWTSPTSGLCPGFVQVNLVLLPKEWAYDFLLFSHRNPKPCPLLDVTEEGDPEPKFLAPGADIRTDLPQYRVWRDGSIADEPTDILKYWRNDLVGFLLGCSFTFEGALLEAGIPVRHIEMGRNVPMYKTNIPCSSAGRLHSTLVVTMRPIKFDKVAKAVSTTAMFPAVHGAPVHIGSPSAIGINDLNTPDFGDSVPVYDDEIPVFWACGVTPQAALMASKVPFAITHAPGCMFISDRKDIEYSIF
jgi:uncharacterized protein YcsI (UPF0317 family)